MTTNEFQAILQRLSTICITHGARADGIPVSGRLTTCKHDGCEAKATWWLRPPARGSTSVRPDVVIAGCDEHAERMLLELVAR
jgi:murein endopeptidase